MERLADRVDDGTLVDVIALGRRRIDGERLRPRGANTVPLVEERPSDVRIERSLGDRARLERPEQVVDARDDDGEFRRATPP